MTTWLWIGYFSAALYWSVFLYLLSRRRWNSAALAVGVLHMLFAMFFMVAPIRSFIDPAYPGFQFTLLSFEGRAATLPSAMFLAWALAAAWISIAKGRGRWMRIIAVGDIICGLLLVANFFRDLLRGELTGTQIQFGEHLTLSGPFWALVLVLLFALPFLVSAIWALSRARSGGGRPPLAVNTDEGRKDLEENTKENNGLRYSQSRA
ncbi:MAG TPA: hypothetical protein VGX92_03585 [Pyrinomonadaceae bacterium]|jgi:hypothetical protein|nr:hypothetical protein [Pyrinomonadaceae bacterium]